MVRKIIELDLGKTLDTHVGINSVGNIIFLIIFESVEGSVISVKVNSEDRSNP
jgi:hypothetical protein